ncbi:hypothetical protein [Hydrogenophaga sp.]|uniref:hypothetical protein n=1 Tax=Hydrogenophaga sp. TaxID=1904254 RepID=UPI00271BF0DF|nr:hypothetical protein [Hydrogenophaga sp.]MDO9438641.1 hypothetical protein [Hydrogenophaga sp.]
MTPLFAALDATGALRFVSEVERGADCGCVCPVCGSSLVARQGAANEWHFAHEASLEQPECEAAALRVLRRLMLEHLQARAAAAGLGLPAFRQRVAIVRALVNLHEDVQWDVRLIGELQWQAPSEAHDPVARGRLDTGVDLHLHLHVAVDDTPPIWPECEGAQLVYRCRWPPASVLRDRRGVARYLDQQAELLWHQHPDTHGLVAGARARLETRSGQLYRNWLAMADAAGGPSHIDDIDAPPPKPLFYGPGTLPTPEQAPRYACAPDHAPNVSFTFYRLADNQSWLLYRLHSTGPTDWRSKSEKFYALAPYPRPFEGWTQALPETVGVADPFIGVIRCRSFLDAVTHLSRRTVLTRSSRDPAAFAGL